METENTKNIDSEEVIQKHLNELKSKECTRYLQSTDWYYARKLETGEEVPTDVVQKRLEAREFIRANE